MALVTFSFWSISRTEAAYSGEEQKHQTAGRRSSATGPSTAVLFVELFASVEGDWERADLGDGYALRSPAFA